MGEKSFIEQALLPDIPNSTLECANIADGANLVFTLVILGWLYSAIYFGWWEMIWHQYHKRVTKLLGPDFKRDWLSKGAVAVSVAAPMLVAVFALKWLWGRLLP